ncbi:MAG: thermopsin family protease [Thermoplasmata archaeon]|nr:thermopsin family protease [Thermoplasmata archaeon]
MSSPGPAGSIAILLLLVASGLALGASGHSAVAAPTSAHAVMPVHHALQSKIVVLPPKRTHALGVHPAGSGVNPYAYYSSEPAPMGIADFGVDSQLNPYRYTTSEIEGNTRLSALTTLNSNTGETTMTIQLNVVLEFYSGSNEFYYWVQDVAFLDTATNGIGFENNIWNFTDGSGYLAANSISGNGTIQSAGSSFYYAAGANPGLPGGSATLTYPAQVNLRVFAKVVSGIPAAVFEYNDGYGWVIYDTANFVFTSAVTAAAYVVDGNNYAPIGLFQDAELVMGGPGNGESTAASAAGLVMTLSFDNGHNLQEIPNAYNFGSNTGESISGIAESRAGVTANGTMDAAVKAGSSTLANLWDRSYAAIVNISSPDGSGTLEVGGTTGLAYRGAEINLTIAPGTYVFTGYLGSTPIGTVNATVYDGEYLVLNLSGAQILRVTFDESGLPLATHWTVTLGGVLVGSTTSSLQFSELIGSYAYTVGLVSGYAPQPAGGTVRVNGVNQTITIAWSLVVYSVAFTEVGLPSGLPWGLTFSGSLLSSTVATIIQAEPNGSYAWRASLLPGYSATPVQGTVSVNGSAVGVQIVWTLLVYPVRFTEIGLPKGTAWSVTLNRTTDLSAVATITFSVRNGTYAYTIPVTSGYAAITASGSIHESGALVSTTVQFLPLQGRIAGVVAPGSALLTINGTPVPLANGSYALSLAPATYNVTVTLDGYQSYTTSVTVGAGQTSFLNISLQRVDVTQHPNPAKNSSGLPLPPLLPSLVALALIAVAVAALVLWRRRSPRA